MDQGREDKIEGKSSVPVAKWYRIYVYEDPDNPDNLWAVDEGTAVTARTCLKVVFGGTTHPSSTDYNPESNPYIPAIDPKFWISVWGVLTEHLDARGRKLILIIRK